MSYELCCHIGVLLIDYFSQVNFDVSMIKVFHRTCFFECFNLGLNLLATKNNFDVKADIKHKICYICQGNHIKLLLLVTPCIFRLKSLFALSHDFFKIQLIYLKGEWQAKLEMSISTISILFIMSKCLYLKLAIISTGIPKNLISKRRID